MQATDHTIRFILNGTLTEVKHPDPVRSVLNYLREDVRHTGTKEGCSEGDCGACTVVIGTLVQDQLQTRTVNACIQFLPTLDGKALFTVEYLRQQSTGELHPVQQAMVNCHGSQCGFCTPGFVMSLWNKYHEYDESHALPDRQELASHLSGNLCRCTGYRPILDAGEKMFELPRAHFNREQIADALRDIARPEALHYTANQTSYDAPRSLDALTQLYSKKPDATLLAGCTDIGLWVNKQFRSLGSIIYVGEVPELRTTTVEPDALHIGAAVPLSDAYARVTKHYPQLAQMWERFASVPVRNAGTLGGNIANGSPIGDSMPWLIALEAEVTIISATTRRSIPLEDLYVGYMKKSLQAGELIEGITVPLPADDLHFQTYKLSKRFDSDISAVCAAFAIKLNGPTITSARVAFGGMAATASRATACEAQLLGNQWDEKTLASAQQALLTDFSPLSDMRASASYRARTSANLLQRFYLETRPNDPLPASQTQVFTRTRVSP